ncbi:MAG: GH3 auxin-responsive promoter family protein [Bacteroidetes bacterium]|nr:GH3 auxin-responsive promoter family protein [Bacteroidota bacterium]MDA1119416.1 GH3 auxin-responsive promoter family protein [Bacteroidota bacterium]
MAIIGTLVKKGIKIRETLEQEYSNPVELQKAELQKLLIHARNTSFGKNFNFNAILKGFKQSGNEFYRLYKDSIPIFDYNKIYSEWWRNCLDGHENVCWPGRIKYFALSSGTSEDSSKRIPVSGEMIKSIQKTSFRQILTLSKYTVPNQLFTSGILMLGGSTHLNHHGTFFDGDLSGITASQLPYWFQQFYKPGKKIAKNPDWNKKIDEIAAKAKDWKIGIIVGIPAWIQIMLERIIQHNHLNTIHDIWPDLCIYVHGGVAFDPYRKSFDRLFAKPMIYMETYLASEGFVAFQAHPNTKSMRIVLNNGIFYEFIPFNHNNFDTDGNLKPNPETVLINNIKEGTGYAPLLSTNAGAWRYLLGDTIKFTSKEDSEIIITGRTKHFLNLCGEHLSIENMNKAIESVAEELNITINEFAVAGIKNGTLWAHQWYVGTEERIDEQLLSLKIDERLKALNDDYRVERGAALTAVKVKILPNIIFYDWMKEHGKIGGQNKFPRVLKNENLLNWEVFLKEMLLNS